MATLPAYVKLGWANSGEERAPIVARTEMDRGVPKQRRIAADALVTVDVTLYFDSAADAASFETWVDASISGGADWFAMTTPRGHAVSARFVGGKLGKLVPANRTWAYSMRQTQVEFLRATL